MDMIGKVRRMKLRDQLSLSEIAKLAALRDQEINEAKKVLATEATALLHGRAAAEEAAATAKRTFEEGERGDALPTISVTEAELEEGVPLLGLFVKAGLVKSNGEARRQIRGGGLRVNDTQISDEGMQLRSTDIADGVIKLSLGKKRHVLVRPV